MTTSALAAWVKSSVEYRSLLHIGESLRDLKAITKEGRALADSLCALIPDALIEKYGVFTTPPEGQGWPRTRLRIARGYEVHLFTSGSKYLMANDGTERYLNADETPEAGWLGPPSASILLFTIDVANGLLDDIDLYVQSFPGIAANR